MITTAKQPGNRKKKYFRYQLDYNPVNTKLELTDYEDNRVIYSTDNNILQEVVEYIYKMYGKINIQVNAIQSEISPLVRHTILKTDSYDTVLDRVVKDTKIAFVKKIYGYIDKYRVGLKPVFTTEGNNSIVYLTGEGSTGEDNRIVYEGASNHYLYYYRGQLEIKTRILEEIFQ